MAAAIKKKVDGGNAEAQSLAPTITSSVCEKNSTFASLAAALAEIRKLKGVSGYILRSSDSAVIDIAEQDKIASYAVLSSQLHQSSREMAKLLGLGMAESVLLEGKEVKILCICIGDNIVSVFMEKSAMHGWIMKRILL